MSWINMLSPWQWLVMAAVPPLIIMLYFLKLRRMPVEVPSTYLWQRTVEDLHVNSIWQRLRKNLLLLLQLLAVLALVLACLRPGFRGEETLGARSIFMIDNSSSMQATDVDGASRLKKAQDETLRMINALGSNDVGMVIAFSDRADVRQGFTTDKNKLRAAVQGVTTTNRTTDLSEALRAASGLANPGRVSFDDKVDVQVADAMPASLYILSDGGFPAPQMDLGNLAAEYIPVGSEEPNNVGIVAFTADRNEENDDQIEAFALVQNFGLESATVTATLTLKDELVDASDVTVEPGESTGVSFSIQNLVEGQLKLEIDDDDFQADNVAYAGLDPPRQLEVVLVTTGNKPMEAALATEQAQAVATVRIMDPDSLESEETKALAQSGTVDLFIYDQCFPEELPEANTLFIGSLPPGGEWKVSEPSGPLFVIDVDRAHPLMQYVDMGTVKIVSGRGLELPEGGVDLVRTQAGILLGVAPREAYQDAVLAMPFSSENEDGDFVPNSDWAIKRSFPVFWLNALEYLGGAVATAGAKTVKPGQPAVLNLASRFDQVEVTDPTGKKKVLDRTGPQLIFTQTDRLGFYTATPVGSERILQMFTVNLFSERESDILPNPDVQIGAQKIDANEEVKDIARIEYWRWLLALALLILSVEWYLYNRRIAV